MENMKVFIYFYLFVYLLVKNCIGAPHTLFSGELLLLLSLLIAKTSLRIFSKTFAYEIKTVHCVSLKGNILVGKFCVRKSSLLGFFYVLKAELFFERIQRSVKSLFEIFLIFTQTTDAYNFISN